MWERETRLRDTCPPQLGVLWVATQATAASLRYQRALEVAWWIIGTLPVYASSCLFQCWRAYEVYATKVFSHLGMVVITGAALVLISVVAEFLIRSRHECIGTTDR